MGVTQSRFFRLQQKSPWAHKGDGPAPGGTRERTDRIMCGLLLLLLVTQEDALKLKMTSPPRGCEHTVPTSD